MRQEELGLRVFNCVFLQIRKIKEGGKSPSSRTLDSRYTSAKCWVEEVTGKTSGGGAWTDGSGVGGGALFN